ncbi:hypothetical protein [Nocardia sp. NPDC051833]
MSLLPFGRRARQTRLRAELTALARDIRFSGEPELAARTERIARKYGATK